MSRCWVTLQTDGGSADSPLLMDQKYSCIVHVRGILRHVVTSCWCSACMLDKIGTLWNKFVLIAAYCLLSSTILLNFLVHTWDHS